MFSWRLAGSLVNLRKEIDAFSTADRAKVHDGAVSAIARKVGPA
jgi:hypothetical protein